MKFSREIKAACAINAAVLTASFSSGREAAAFFTCMGWASWPGIVTAAVVFGLFMGMICHFAIETGASDLPGIYYRKLDERCGDTMGVVHALLMLMMGAVALSTVGELGMLSLNGKHPYIIGAALAMAAAAAVSLSGMKMLSWMGMVLTPVFVIFFCALALDRRPSAAEVYIAADTPWLKGNLPAAVFAGALFACLKAAMACGVAAVHARGLKPARFGMLCGVMMGVTACAANWALISAGSNVWTLNLPAVVLSARWGLLGYYICIFVMWTGAAAVLSCAMNSVMTMFSARLKRPQALILTVTGVIMMSVVGLRSLVGVGYPMLGWICALCLCALAFFYDRRGGKSIYGLKSVG